MGPVIDPKPISNWSKFILPELPYIRQSVNNQNPYSSLPT